MIWGTTASPGRLRICGLALLLALSPAGCAHLKRTELVSKHLHAARSGKLLGKSRPEPALDLPSGPTHPQSWTGLASNDRDLAASSSGRSRNAAPALPGTDPEAVRAASAPAPAGAVPALGVNRQTPPPRSLPETLPLASATAADVSPEPRSQTASSTNPAPNSAPVSPAPSTEDPLATVEKLIQQSKQAIASASTYRLDLTRQERVDGRLLPQEKVILSVRRQPLGIRLEWPQGGPNAGREVLFSDTECEGLMHIKLGASPIPLPPMKMAPDSPLAMKNSRRPIQTAGLDPVIDETARYIQAMRAGETKYGVLTYEGIQPLDGSGQPNHKIVRKTPEGEVWILYLDPETLLPTQVDGRDASGEILEAFRFDRIELNPADLAQADAFDPKVRLATPSGGASGFLGRLARAAQEKQGDTSTDEPTLPK